MFMVKVVEVLDSVKLDPIKEEVFFLRVLFINMVGFIKT